jgi:hypothetical protein
VALHQIIQRALRLGAKLDVVPAPPVPPPPPALAPLIDSIAAGHRLFDERAVQYGDRYRSGYWVIYVLSAVAVLFAVLPLALARSSSSSSSALFIGKGIDVTGRVSGCMHAPPPN